MERAASSLAPHSVPCARARVVLPEPVPPLDYGIPDTLRGALQPGAAVRVPLGKRHTVGYVVALCNDVPPEGLVLRDIESLDDGRAPLPEAVLRLVLFAADYYGVAAGEVLEAALPPSARPTATRYRRTQQPAPAALSEPDATVLALGERFAAGFTVVAAERALECSRASASARLRKLCDKGLLEVAPNKRAAARQARRIARRAGADTRCLGARHQGARDLFETLPPQGSVALKDLLAADPRARSRVATLHKAGLVDVSYEPQRLAPHAFPPVSETPPALTPDQSRVMAELSRAIEAQTFATFLLQGVTGSGKTEVYKRAIAYALEQGRSALILVPEIALTPQLGERFRARFGERVATFHSGLTAAERRDEWERVASGAASIGLGARSALFLPLQRVGVIVVDEEHETSFKQDETPRYNARDLAVVRGRHEGAVVVLGSATPSLESHANAGAQRYRRLVLPARVTGRPLPEVEVVDLAAAPRVGDGVFTERLARATERVLAAGEQVILFLNRRGFAPYVFCGDCGHAYRCDACDVSLTLHRRRGRIVCHYCGYEDEAPDVCHACNSHRVNAFGLGTERIEAEVRALFGAVPTLRLDRDVVRNKNSLASVLERFRSGEARVLIGTQMVAKGHDFPGVTLVGVVSADASLNFPDFRAAERTFQLLTQVSGRAGRGSAGGFVIVQAYEGSHYAIEAASRHDFNAFVEHELVTRRELCYPPYAHLALLRCEGRDEARTEAAAGALREALQAPAANLGITVLGPAAAPLARLRDIWRFHILLKSRTRNDLGTLLRQLPRRGATDVRRIVDVDPINML